MITLLKKIAIRERPTEDLTDPDPSPYLNTVELVNVMEGVDGAATFGYSLETVAVQVEDNQTQQYKHIHTLDVRVLDAGGDNATIDAWIAEQKPVDIVGIGIDGYFQFDNVKLTRNKQYDEVFASAFLATAETMTSYTSPHIVPYWYYSSNLSAEKYIQATETKGHTKLRAFAGANLYDIYDLDVSRSNINGAGGSVWQNGTYYPYTQDSDDNTNHLTSNVIDSSVKLIRPDVGDSLRYALYEGIFFPFENESLTASINVVELNTGAGNTAAALRILEVGGNADINRTSTVEITEVGRTSFDITTTSNTRVVHLQVRPGVERDSNMTFDDIGIYPTAVAPLDASKKSPSINTNPEEPPVE